jgi:hypothetical protein
MGLPGAHDLELEADVNVMTLLRLCDPAIPIDTDDNFTTFWTQALHHIDALLSRHPLSPPPLPPPPLEFEYCWE